MPKPLRDDYRDDELVKFSMQLWGKVLKQLDKIAQDRGITRTKLFYIILRDWLMSQGYRVDPGDFDPPSFGPELGSTYDKD